MTKNNIVSHLRIDLSSMYKWHCFFAEFITISDSSDEADVEIETKLNPGWFIWENKHNF